MTRPFAVAFSLAGEQRAIIEPVATKLEERGYPVFFYAWPRYVAELAKPNLDTHLRRIYGEQTQLLVPVFSAEYARKPWTGVVELTVVREVIFDRRDDEVMPLRTDDTIIEGFSKLHGYVDLRGRTADEIANLIEQRLRPVTGMPVRAGQEPAVSSPRPSSTLHPLVQGIQARSYSYAGRVHNFLGQYLDSSSRSVPFGGRDREMAELSAWLDDAGAPPYRVIAGPAGRGKSALLARWVQELLPRESLGIAYFPISVRFETNAEEAVFSSMVARLAHLTGNELPRPSRADAVFWREEFARHIWQSHVANRTLLVILDGLDEALGWQVGPGLFPDPPPPAGLRVVVAARTLAGHAGPSAWMDRLGWSAAHTKTSSLRPLTVEALAEILARTPGTPTVRLGEAVVQELFRLTQGDPLLVKLHVEALWSGGSNREVGPERLARVLPGLAGYFNRWREEHESIVGSERAGDARILLHLLASALGPLGREDLAEIAHDAGAITNSYNLDSALQSIARFVIGDGRTQGYTLSHSRLAQHFWEEVFTEADRRTWERRFLGWCERTLARLADGTLPYEQAPPYVVRSYRAHLERSGASAESWISLASVEWFRAWDALAGEPTGFLADSMAAWHVFEEADRASIGRGGEARFLGAQIRCALAVCSVRSIVTNLSPELLAALVRAGLCTVSEGVAVARSMDLATRVEALVSLAVLTEGDVREAIVTEALAVSKMIRSSDSRAYALHSVLPLLRVDLRASEARALLNARSGLGVEIRALVCAAALPWVPRDERTALAHETLAALEAVGGQSLQPRVVALLIPYLPPALADDAIKVASQGSDASPGSPLHYWRAKSLVLLIPGLPEPQRGLALEKARAALYASTGHSLEELLSSLVPHLSRAEGDKLIRHARDLALKDSGYVNAALLAAVARHLPPEERAASFEQAMTSVRGTIGPGSLQTLTRVAHHVDAGRRVEILQDALRAAEFLDDASAAADAIAALVRPLPAAKKLSDVGRALAWVRAMRSSHAVARSLATLSPCIASELFPEALSCIRTVGDEGWRSNALTDVAPHVPVELVASALDVARTIQAPAWRARALLALGARLRGEAAVSALEEALAVADEANDVDTRAMVLAALARTVPIRRQEIALVRVLDALQHIATGPVVADVYRDLAAWTPRRLIPRLLQHVQQRDSRPWIRVTALTALAARVSAKERSAILRDAVASARVPDNMWHARAYQLLPPLPPDLLRSALSAARKEADAATRAEAITALVPQATVAETPALLRDALAAAHLANPYMRQRLVLSMLPWLPGQLAEEARALVVMEDEPPTAARLEVTRIDLNRKQGSSENAPALCLEAVLDILKATEPGGWPDLTALGLSKLRPERLFDIWCALLRAKAVESYAARSAVLALISKAGMSVVQACAPNAAAAVIDEIIRAETSWP